MPVKGLQLLCFVAALAVADPSVAQTRPPGPLDHAFDLKRAVLSPAPLGPASHFEPAAAPAETSTAPVEPAPTPTVAAKPDKAPVVTRAETTTPRKASSKPRQKSAVAARKPKSNPLNSFARDANRQTWPCTGGGICAWTRPR